MKKKLPSLTGLKHLLYSLCFMLLCVNVGRAQTTVFNDTFTTASGSYVTAGASSGTVTSGTTSYTAYESGTFFSAVTGVTTKELNNVGSNTIRSASTISGALSAVASPFSPTLNANKGIITWTFNIKNDKSAAQSPLASAFSFGNGSTSGSNCSTGVVLVTDNSASSNISAASITTKGWAVVMTQGTATTANRLDLGYFDAGLTNSGFHSVLNTGDLALNAAVGSTIKYYYSVRVAYNPSTNAWSMSYRADASSGTAVDPSDTSGTWVNASLTSGVLTNVNTNATTTAMSNFMFYYNHNGTNTAGWDNFKVVVGEVVNAPSPASLSTFYYAEGAGPSAAQSFTFTTNTATIPSVTLPGGSNYEICNTAGGTYSAAPTIAAVTPVSGVYTYIIYARLKAGLAAGSYAASENVTISTSGSIASKTVALSGGTVSAGTDTTPPDAPGTFTAVGGNRTDTSISLTWGASATTGADLTGYLLVRYSSTPVAETGSNPVNGTTYAAGDTYLSTPNSKVGTVVYAGSNLTFTDTNLTESTSYYYKVYAYDLARNYSAASSDSPFTARTRALLLTPLATTAEVTATGFNANWQHVNNASSYSLYVYTNPGATTNIVGWTFPDTWTGASGYLVTADVANANNTTKKFSLSTGTLSSAAGVATNAASASTFYSNSGALTIPVKWFQVDANTTGYKDIKVSSSMYGNSASSARDFKLQYSITGPTGTFTDVTGGAITCTSGAWVTLTDLALPAECENAGSLSLRWMQASFTDISGNEMLTASSSVRIDNIYVKGSALSTVSGYPVTVAVTGTPAVGDALSSARTMAASGTYYYDVVANPGSGSSAYVASLHSNLMSAVYVDNVVPANPGTVTVGSATPSSLGVSWAAASSIDGGGYTVVRYTTSPAANNDPTQKTTYVAGNKFTNGDGSLEGTVVYSGTSLTCSDTSLSGGTTYYYKVYTYDQDHNYSDESSGSGTTSATPLTAPVATTSSTPTETGFTANWGAVSDAVNYDLYLYNANTPSNIVGWTFPISGTTLTADVTSANNLTNTLVQSSGTVNTAAGATTQAISAATWYAAIGKYWEVPVNTTGYQNVKVSSKISSTGPKDFKLQYKIGAGGTYADVTGGAIVCANNYTTGVLSNLVLPAECNNQSSVYLRWINYTDKAISSTDAVPVVMTSVSGGTAKLDDVYVAGGALSLVSGYPVTVSGTSSVLSGLSPGGYYYDVVAKGNGIVYSDSAKSNLITSSIVPIPQSVADYKSVGTASTSSATNWEYNNGTAYVTASAAPTSANNITVSTGNEVALGTNFSVNSGKTMTVDGTINLAGYTVSGAGTFTLSSGASLKLGNNVSLASAITATTTTLSVAANYFFDGTTVAQHTGGLPGSVISNPSASNGSQSYTASLTGNVTVSNPAGVTMNQGLKITGATYSLTVTSTGKLLFGDGNVASSPQSSSAYNSGTYNYSGTGNFVAVTGCTLSITSSKGISGTTDGNIKNTGTRTFNPGINYIFAKNDTFNPISMGTSFGTEIDAATGINNLTINDPYGVFVASTYTSTLSGTANTASNVTTTTYTGTAASNIIVNGVLNIVSGKLYTSDYVTVSTNSATPVTINSVDYYPSVSTVITPVATNPKTVIIGESGSITGAGSGTGWVVGDLKKATTSGNSPSFTYAIGDATSYSPLTVTFTGNTSAAGSLTASTASGDHASISTSDLISSKSVNRTWTLTNDALAGFGTYSAAFGFATGDNDAGTTPANFGARLYNNGSWSYLTTTNTSDIAATATGITGFGDFAIGEFVGAPAAEPASFCSSVNPTIASLSGSTSATAPKWYAAVTGGSALASEVALASGTYYVSQTIGGVESLRTPVGVTVTSSTITGSESVSACGTSYTWPLNGQSYSASGTYTHVVGCNTATLTLTLTPNTTTGSESVSACGSSYTWPLNGQSYTASGTYTHVVGCNTATLTLTLTPATNHTTTVSAFNTYTWANNGETYTTSGIKTGTTTNCVTEKLDLTITTTQIPTSPMALCAGKYVSDAIGSTTLKFYKDNLAKTTVPLAAATTKLVSGTTYWVTEMINSVESTPRVPVVVNLTALVAPTAIASVDSKVICKYMGTQNLATFTTTPVSGASNYTWNVSSIAGAAIVGNATGDTITVSFEGVSGTPALIGSVTVDSNNALGCPSGKPKALALTTKAPTAAKSVALTYNGVAVKKAGNFVHDGTKTLTLTVTDPSLTADHYDFVLPEGVNNVTGATSVEGSTTLYRATYTSTSTVLTFDLGLVTAANTPLVFTCTSVGGCGSASKSLSVARAEAGTPKGINLYDTESATPAIAIKKLDSYTGSLKTRTLTLTATPNLTAGSEASSYKWVLPAGVNTSATPEGHDNTYISTSPSILINLANVGAETAFTFKVYGVNGNGASLLSKDLACTSAAPKAPAAIYAGTNTGLTGTKFLAYSPSCGTVTISVPAVFGVDNNFEVTAGTAGLATIASHEPGSNVATIDLSALGGSVAAKSTITIRAIATTATGSVYKDYIIKIGTSCSTPTRIAPEAPATEAFQVVAYPNPSSDVFTLEVQSSSKGETGVQVYDMAGRLIEQRQVNSNSVEVGRNYASGIYNVIVNQGANVKTLRVIKQ